jgi:hypothetical protein
MIPTEGSLLVVGDLCDPPAASLSMLQAHLWVFQNTVRNIIHQIQDLESTARFYSVKILGWHVLILKFSFKVRNNM